MKKDDSKGFSSRFPLHDFLRLVNSDYLCKLYGEAPGDDILPPENVEAYFYHYTTYIATSRIDGRLRGFVVIGDFSPSDDGDSRWPAWKSAKFPPSNEQVTVCLNLRISTFCYFLKFFR